MSIHNDPFSSDMEYQNVNTPIQYKMLLIPGYKDKYSVFSNLTAEQTIWLEIYMKSINDMIDLE